MQILLAVNAERNVRQGLGRVAAGRHPGEDVLQRGVDYLNKITVLLFLELLYPRVHFTDLGVVFLVVAQFFLALGLAPLVALVGQRKRVFALFVQGPA